MASRGSKKSGTGKRGDADAKRKRQALNPETARQMVKPTTKGRLTGGARSGRTPSR
jgi:hypothetical protein